MRGHDQRRMLALRRAESGIERRIVERMRRLAVAGRIGQRVRPRRIGGRDDVRQHLAELGFVVDSPVLIVSHMAGNLIVQVKGSRVALDRSMAQKIFY